MNTTKAMRHRAAVALLCLVGATAAACSKKEEAATEAAPSASAPPVAPTGAILDLVIDAKGKASIDMPAPKEHIKADATGATGWLQVDPKDLTASRGEVKLDLATLTTRTFDDADKNESQTKHARTWLEAVVDGKTNEANRWAVFTIQSIDGASATELAKVTPTQDAGEDIRKVTLTVHGELLIHGHKAKKDASVEVRFHYPKDARPESRPTRADVKTTSPLHVVLADHDVKPRDTFGMLAKGALGLLGTKVADTADVSLDLTATPK